MAFTTEEQEAVTRLDAYNGDAYDASTNPQGLAGDGYKKNPTTGFKGNWDNSTDDIATVANAVSRESQSVATNTTQVSTDASQVATDKTAVANDRVATEAARDQAVAAAGAVTALNNLTATSDPTANHDSADTAGDGTEYSAGSFWINTSTQEVFRCIDASVGAAIWIKTTFTVDELGSIATQNSNAVTITGGELINVKERKYQSGMRVDGRLKEGVVKKRYYAVSNERWYNISVKLKQGTCDIGLNHGGANEIGFGATPSNTVAVTSSLVEHVVNDDGAAYETIPQGAYVELTISNITGNAEDLMILIDKQVNRD